MLVFLTASLPHHLCTLVEQATDFAEFLAEAFPAEAYLEGAFPAALLEEAYLEEAFLGEAYPVAYLEEVEVLKRRYLPELFAEK